MKKFFFSHPDVTLATIAIVLLVILIGFFSWAINDVILQVRQATVSSPAAGQQGFDLQDAATLNLRGLSTSTQSSSDVSIPTTAASSTL